MGRVVLSSVVVCLLAVPASAELFEFHFLNPLTAFDSATSETGTLAVSNQASTMGNVGTAMFQANSWSTLGGALSIGMNIESITASTATATGTFSFTDTDGDTIQGNLSGNWLKTFDVYSVVGGVFNGQLSAVTWSDNEPEDGTFNGHSGSMGMSFGSGPWTGSIFQFELGNGWFSDGDFDSYQGSIHGAVVPAPVAVVLGMLGLGVAGLKLRKLA